MIKNVRKDPFRYQFTHDFSCLFKILEINEKQVSTKLAEATLLDVSKSGCKLATALDLNSVTNKMKLRVSFEVEGMEFSVPGSVRWQSNTHPNCLYGINFELQDKQKEQILFAIRTLANNRHVVVK
jgi:hypothetical protein